MQEPSTNKALRTLFVSNGVFVFAGNLLGPLYAVFVEGIDNKILTISLTWATYHFSSTLFSLLFSKIRDKFLNEKFMLAAGFVIRAFVWFGYIFVDNIATLFALQFILGLGFAVGTPAFNAIFAEHLDKQRHIADYSKWIIIEQVVGTIGVLLGGYVVSLFGFPSLFASMALLAIISTVLLLTSKNALIPPSSLRP